MDGEGTDYSPSTLRDESSRSRRGDCGITTRPDQAWMLQVGRNLTDSETGVLRSKQYVIIDRDSKYSAQFRRLIQDGGTKVIRLPPRSPNLNAHAERFVRSIKDE